MSANILIVGAGPTGLVLALSLARYKVPFRIISQNAGPGEASRAIVVQARTLEYYQQLGIADLVVARGIKIENIEFYKHKKKMGSASIANIGANLSPFPYALSLAQDEHEKLLVTQLEKLNIQVEYNTSLLTFDKSTATIKTNLGTEVIPITYIAGCDGAHSTVRHVLDIQFPGGTYEDIFYVADVNASNAIATHNLAVGVDDHGFCILAPVRTSGSFRLIGLVPPDLSTSENIVFDALLPSINNIVDISVSKVNWFASYRVHHRVANNFEKENVFLLGDAAHIHSPAGGQGMNTGIGDAMNLAWKLASVSSGVLQPTILKTYEFERRKFALKLVLSTDKAFKYITAKGWTGKLVRDFMIPYIVPKLLTWSLTRKIFFKTISQITVNYRGSKLCAGKISKLAPGDRLPWLNSEGVDNFQYLDKNWQLHYFGTQHDEAKFLSDKLTIKLINIPFSKHAKSSNFKLNTFYLIRPDGYISAIGKATAIIAFWQSIKA
jgi:2-polyprenyl-6-methoxyphenol hydroxylase-like FAD-dependent oxidoreductase